MTAADLSASLEATPRVHQVRPVAWRTTLAEVRQSWGLSVDDVAKATGLTVGVITQAELGCDLFLTHAVKLAEFYLMPVERIWTRATGRE